MNKRVVITGIGPITSIGIGKDDLWKSLIAQKTNVVKENVYIGDELWADYYVHKVANFNLNDFGIDKEKINRIKDWKEGEEIVDLNYLIAAIKLALDDSRMKYDGKSNISLVLAHENIGLMPFGLKIGDLAYEMLIDQDMKTMSKKEFLDKFYRKVIKSGYDVQTFANLFHVTQVFNIDQFSLFINNACASGLYSIETASQMIRNGMSDVVAVASSDCPDVYKYLWFKDLGIYSKDGLVRPFSRDSNGLVFGEGGASLILEDLEHARKRGAKIYAEYAGGGFHLENWKITIPQIGSSSYQEAMFRAFKNSKVKKDEIDFVCPHGVGSAPIDYYEAKAINEVFSSDINKLLISTFKPYIGHNLGGSALLETAILLLCLEHNVVLPTLNRSKPDPRYKLNLVREKQSVELKTVMKTCCAFAGFNAAAIFRKVD